MRGPGQSTGQATRQPPRQPIGQPGAVEAVGVRYEFYRDGYRFMFRANLVLAIGLILSIGLHVAQWLTPDREFFIATSADGRLLPIQPLDEPVVNIESILGWAQARAVGIHTFGFHDWRERFTANRHYFTQAGWDAFVTGIENSGNLEAVRNKRMVLTAVPKAAPVLVDEGVRNGRYTWIVEMVLSVTYQSSSEQAHQDVHVVLHVQRVPVRDNPDGLAIAQFIGRDI